MRLGPQLGPIDPPVVDGVVVKASQRNRHFLVLKFGSLVCAYRRYATAPRVRGHAS
jgi:hypothetical protein